LTGDQKGTRGENAGKQKWVEEGMLKPRKKGCKNVRVDFRIIRKLTQAWPNVYRDLPHIEKVRGRKDYSNEYIQETGGSSQFQMHCTALQTTDSAKIN